MKYDKERDIIKIELEEFVGIARRGISPIVPCDRDEPDVRPTERRHRAALPEGAAARTFEYNAKIEDRQFCIRGIADGAMGSEIFIIREWESTAKSPRKEDVAETRGEGFVLGYFLAKAEKLDSVMLTIVYINKKTGGRVTTKEEIGVKKLETFFKKCSDAVAKFATPEIERVTVRLPSMKEARFPYGKVRDGQSEFITEVYKTIARGGNLFATAPTGTGKTVSVLYPAIRALGAEKCDKVFYFTPKNTTAEAARECLFALNACGVELKAVMITAKERICPRGVLCREGKDLCPATKDNKVIEAAMKLYADGSAVVDDKEIGAAAEKFCVCPHELALTYSELCDVVICDINYLFNPQVYIKRYFNTGGHFAFLIDEAHNLPDRAREMYSAAIREDEIDAFSRLDVMGECARIREIGEAARDTVHALLFPYLKDEIRTDKDGKKYAFAHISEPPSELYGIFESLREATESALFEAMRAKDEDAAQRVKVLRSYYSSVARMHETLEAFDDGFEMFISLEEEILSFKLFCIDTAIPIAKRLAKGNAAILFSATLTPVSYYRSVLGGDRGARAVEIDSPFDPSQLSVTVMDKISTRYSERENTLGAVCRVIAACVSAKRGHYMIFSPSFAYSDALAKSFAAKYPKLKILVQKKDMSAKEKREFLRALERAEGNYLVAFCVMGGIYSEGIDLAGDSLIGAVIVGIGIPQLSVEREAIAAYYDEKSDSGKEYAYIYPGMNRVFQAAGRVIRREDDRGVVVLIDDRFADPIYKKSLPSLWEDIAFLDDAKALRERLDEFWKETE